MIHGILNINKPRGLTSHDVVAMVRRLLGQQRVGHAGTLDPAACGVLLVCVGKATRIAEYLMERPKVYLAEIVLGMSTNTYDSEGQITHLAQVHATLTEVETAVRSFQGEWEQRPPMYSATKHRGRPLYSLARAGLQAEVLPRRVEVYHISVVSWEPPVVTVRLECGKGTYVRSIAHGLGEKLGCGAYLRYLVRLASGDFTLADAVTIAELEHAFQHGYWEQLVYPLDEALLHYSAVVLGEENAQRVRNGSPCRLSVEAEQLLCPDGIGATFGLHRRSKGIGANLCRAYSSAGEMVAVLRLDRDATSFWPAKVLG